MFTSIQQNINTWQASALVGGLSFLYAGAPVVAGRGIAGHVEDLAMLASVLQQASAVVGAHLVDTSAAILADRGILGALVDILLAGLPVEGRRTVAQVMGLKGSAGTAVGTWV